ncbi:hypothetical protein RXV86_18910 [Alisedimentitalea sp. MJ-SS2]|uniref:hypothetical protein n=1 Tax=Aliisedimentitalea sp. MJ-SS2 TaxID=3049795 RepID=UPI00290D1B98|nr:hypothetical protein [Alisedimentitalea sp. MJ-SS2]MDU8929464.1 hypothetical protein [Alisedimentitalea sp. MJ-SS2]
MKHEQLDPEMTAEICEIVLRERSMSLSEREWKFRLRGYGYAIKDTDHGQVITSLLKKTELCTLPEITSDDDDRRAA